jgi:hypothetical protein
MQFLLYLIPPTMVLPNFIVRFLAGSPVFTRSPKPLIRLDSNNQLHITIFSDLHYGEEESGWGISQDINSTRVINKILDSESPDLVILSSVLDAAIV